MTTRRRPDIALNITATCGHEFVPWLRRMLRSALSHVRNPPRVLDVALVGDRTMSGLHRRFLGIAGPTDVLTFPLEHDRRGRVVEGEIVLCVPHARREARARGTAPRDELLLYAIHGVLHLCGHDDTTPGGFRRMHRLEDRILQAIGVGPVFEPGSGPTAARRPSP